MAITITVSDEVYRNLQTVAGTRTITELLEDLTRPIIAESRLEMEYCALTLDAEREREASEWIEGLVQVPVDANGDASR